MRKITLTLIDLRTMKVFEKEFKTEFEKDKFKRRLAYSKHLKVLNDNNYVE